MLIAVTKLLLSLHFKPLFFTAIPEAMPQATGTDLTRSHFLA